MRKSKWVLLAILCAFLILAYLTGKNASKHVDTDSSQPVGQSMVSAIVSGAADK